MSEHYKQRKAANERYLATQDEIKVRAPKGTRERWRVAAEAAGAPSLQRFIIDAVEAAVAAQDDKKE